MSDLSVDLSWYRTTPELRAGAYSNAHTVRYNETSELYVDAAPDWGGDASNTNPFEGWSRAAAALLPAT